MTKHLETLAKTLGEILSAQQLTLATAESCTAGGLGFWVTSIPGSSTWYERGFITYTDIAKVELLGVDIKTLELHGAVSEKTALEMAEGTLANSHADISIAITGIAGPDGGSIDKPVGTVWISFAKRGDFLHAAEHHFKGSRHDIRLKSIECALERLIDLLRQ